MIQKILIPLFACILITSCGSDGSNSDTTVISGQIINPKGTYITLTNTKFLRDTISIDENGFFSHKFFQEKEGLFSFNHGELQYLYLQPGDSILFRINTLEFDESLAFSGKGAEKNNYLIEQFLKNEKFNTTLPEHFKLEPKEFEEIISEEKKNKSQFLKTFNKDNHFSKSFLKLAESTINYNYYSQKELYTRNKNNTYNQASFKFPKDFYKYRSTVDFNNTSLSNYYAYYSFLNRYFDNVAFDRCKKIKPNTEYNREAFLQVKHKLELIDESIKNENLHNHILTSTVRRYLLNADNSEEETKIIALYNSLDRDKADQDYIKQYAKNSSRINAGNKVSNLMLVNLENESVMLNDIMKQHTVLYFWSSKNIKHVKEIHSTVAELKRKFPEYHFIGINKDTNFKDWKKVVTNSAYNDEFEYQFEDPKLATNALLINSNNKALILDKNGIILEGNSHIFNQNFENKLLGFLNK